MEILSMSSAAVKVKNSFDERLTFKKSLRLKVEYWGSNKQGWQHTWVAKMEIDRNM